MRIDFYPDNQPEDALFAHSTPTRSPVASAIFALLNPIPFGFFVAALIFDIIYARSGEILWVKAAAWLIPLGLIVAIVPRLINLVYIWRPKNHASGIEKLDFWLNLVGIAAAILNAFVHSRDAYAAMPDGVELSVVTIVCMSLGLILVGSQRAAVQGGARG